MPPGERDTKRGIASDLSNGSKVGITQAKTNGSNLFVSSIGRGRLCACQRSRGTQHFSEKFDFTHSWGKLKGDTLFFRVAWPCLAEGAGSAVVDAVPTASRGRWLAG